MNLTVSDVKIKTEVRLTPTRSIDGRSSILKRIDGLEFENMATETGTQELADRMAAGDQDALREVVTRFGPKIRGWLGKKFSQHLSEIELGEAFNHATYNLWRFADRYDESKGKLSSWYLRIAYRAAQSILRRERKRLSRNLEYDPAFDPTVDYSKEEFDDETPFYSDECVSDLQRIVDEKLKGLQKAIVVADLLAGGQADSLRLAELHGTTVNVVKVSRNKARKNIHKWMLKMGYNEQGQKQ